MLDLSGYCLEAAFAETPASWLYRGRRLADDRAVLAKTPKAEAIEAREGDRYRYEWCLLQEIGEVQGVTTVLDVLLDREAPVSIVDDPGGQFLSQLSGTCDLATFLTIACQLAETLSQLHAARIVHCNIAPGNILFDAGAETATLMNFSRALQTQGDRTDSETPLATLEQSFDLNLRDVKSLAYVAPEQTGRVKRGIDYRTDFYALGVTLFELLTGQLPFDRDEPLDLIHAHIAQAPPQVTEIDPSIPEAIGAILGKLLEKMPEDRYQSAWGLQTDLVLCLIQWEATGEIEPLIPAEHDAVDRLQLPKRLYGRESELAQLAASFQRIGLLDTTGEIADRAAPELLLVSGEGGIGKSSLIAESFKPIAPQYGYVLSGRFESSPNELTYAAFLQVAQAFARQLLTETSERFAEWRLHLNERLGPDLQALAQLVPELQCAIEPDDEAETQATAPTSFLFILQRFLRALGESRYPVAILLDDLQWADISTLQFLEDLLADAKVHSLTLVGAYRSDRGSAIASCGQRLRDRGVSVQFIELASLDITSTIALIADTLRQPQPSVVPLASLVYQKTDGHPFFVREFLKTLYNEQLLHFDDESKSWQWDLERISSQAITTNVIDLMLGKLGRLPDRSRQVLSRGAFLGRTFELHRLARLCDLSVLDTLHELTPAIVDGLLYPVWNNDPGRDERAKAGDAIYEFLHDLVRRAAYQAMAEADRPAIHLHTGQLLLDSYGERAFSREHLPDLIYQWNAGAAAIDDDRDRIARARLNLAAAQQAKQEGEYAGAMTYCETGLAALQDVTLDLATIAPHLQLELRLERATLDYLQGNLDRSERCIYELLPEAQRPDDLAALYSLIVVEQTVRGDYERVWETLTAGAEQLGISLHLDDGTPWQEQMARWPVPISAVEIANWASATPESRADRDRRTTRMAMSRPLGALLEQAIAPAALAGRPERLAAIVTQIVARTETPQPELMTAYAVGAVLFHSCGDVGRSQQWIGAARMMRLHCGEPRMAHRMQAIHDIYFAPWYEPIAKILPRLERLTTEALDTREVQYAGYIQVASLALGLYRGIALPKLTAQLEDVAAFCEYHHDSWDLALLAHLRTHFQRLQQDSTQQPESVAVCASNPDYFDVSIVGAIDAVHCIHTATWPDAWKRRSRWPRACTATPCACWTLSLSPNISSIGDSRSRHVSRPCPSNHWCRSRKRVLPIAGSVQMRPTVTPSLNPRRPSATNAVRFCALDSTGF